MRVSAAAGLVLSGAAGIALSADIASGGPILADRWTILARLTAWVVSWAVAVWCALRLPRRLALGLVFAVALGLRLAALAGPPTLSDDLYRYAWDGRVQDAGIDPYAHRPVAQEVVGLREPWLWPNDQGCAELRRKAGCSRLNREAERTIYPPLAQRWFSAVYDIAGIDARHKAWQVAGLATDLGLVGMLPFVLRAWKRDERWTALYALSPVPVLEVVNNAHVDGLAALLAVAALWAAARRRAAFAGALLGGAALVKLYPALLLLGLAGIAAATAGRRRIPALVRAGAAAVAVGIAGYLPHVLDAGVKVLGYLPGYLQEEKYGDGGRFLLTGIVPGPPALAAALAAAGLTAAIAWTFLAHKPPPEGGWRAENGPPGAMAVLMGALLLATTPVQPWYAVTLLAVASVAARPAWSLVAVAAYPYFFAVILDAANPSAVGRWSYGLALAGVVALGVRARVDDHHDRDIRPGPPSPVGAWTRTWAARSATGSASPPSGSPTGAAWAWSWTGAHPGWRSRPRTSSTTSTAGAQARAD